MSNLIKIRPVGAELFRADGWTDMTKLIVTFHNFPNAPENNFTQDAGCGGLDFKWSKSHLIAVNRTPKNLHNVQILVKLLCCLYTVISYCGTHTPRWLKQLCLLLVIRRFPLWFCARTPTVLTDMPWFLFVPPFKCWNDTSD
jgi:hypothetical protein